MLTRIPKASKRHFTLLELIIAMSLTLILMSTLLYFYRDLSKIGFETNKLTDTHFYWQYAGSRLADILPRTAGVKDEDFLFYSIDDSKLTKPGSQNLIFAFDNKVSLDKDFSNVVIGRLYVDNNDQLTLAYWPPLTRWTNEEQLPPMKKEILKQNVDSISFEFFVPPEKSKIVKPGTSTTGTEIPVSGGWLSKPWLREYHSLPAMVKMIVIPKKQAKNPEPQVIYVFPLVNTNYRIVYE